MKDVSIFERSDDLNSNKLSRKEKEYNRHRKEILEVALDLFSEKCLYTVTMFDIAKKV